jgi:hypothetical protein
MSDNSRFAKYQRDDLPQLVKLEEGDSFTARMTGEHEYEGTDGPVPVLELEMDGEEFGWRASAWRAINALAAADPQIGDTVEVRRLPDRGRSHDYTIRVVSAPETGGGQVVPSDDDIPFAPSVI